MMSEKPPSMKFRPVTQQCKMAYRTRTSLTFSSVTMIERPACSGVSDSESVGLSLPLPYTDASVTGVDHDSRCARAAGVGKKDCSAASLTNADHDAWRRSSVGSGSCSSDARGSICIASVISGPTRGLPVSKS